MAEREKSQPRAGGLIARDPQDSACEPKSRLMRSEYPNDASGNGQHHPSH